jgi:hypothetical protein
MYFEFIGFIIDKSLHNYDKKDANETEEKSGNKFNYMIGI